MHTKYRYNPKRYNERILYFLTFNRTFSSTFDLVMAYPFSYLLASLRYFPQYAAQGPTLLRVVGTPACTD